MSMPSEEEMREAIAARDKSRDAILSMASSLRVYFANRPAPHALPGPRTSGSSQILKVP